MQGMEVETRFITLPSRKKADWRGYLSTKLNEIRSGQIDINCQDWPFSCRDLKQLISIIDRAGLKISIIRSEIPETIVSAAALGHETFLILTKGHKESPNRALTDLRVNKDPNILFHEGTLRSGEHLEAEGDVLLLGDVNPGAKISAGGNVMIWGRLRGIAHAGKYGDQTAKITALELRPLQLRIANEVARGPEELPEPGLTEQAELVSGKIVIQPARSRLSSPKRPN